MYNIGICLEPRWLKVTGVFIIVIINYYFVNTPVSIGFTIGHVFIPIGGSRLLDVFVIRILL